MTRPECAGCAGPSEIGSRHQRVAGCGRLHRRFFRAIFTNAVNQGWQLLASPYALNEVLKNLPKLPPQATADWQSLRPQLSVAADVVTLDRPAIFTASKDRPILFTALAWADVLLTLDKEDFAGVLGGTFYGLTVLLPYDFLERERDAGRWQ